MKLDRVTKSYGGKVVLRDFSLCLPDRGFCCILGRSGAGKTTVLRLLAGLEAPDRGTVTPSGPVSMVFQEDRLLPQNTVLENVALVSHSARAEALLTALGLRDFLHHRPKELSGGMRRRVAIARALAAPARVYLMDEPFKGLDGDTRQEVFRLVRQETRHGLLVLVTHDPQDTQGADLVITVEPPE